MKKLIEELRGLVEQDDEKDSKNGNGKGSETEQAIQALRDTDYRDKEAFFKMVQLLKGLAVASGDDKLAQEFLSKVSDELTDVAEELLGDEVEEGVLGEGKMILSDKKVIKAFTEKKAADGKKLTTDGSKLDGNWMGGSKIAEWKDGKIVFNDLGSKAAQAIQQAVRKEAPKNWIAEGKKSKDKEISQTYYKYFSGIQVNMMDIPKIYKEIEALLLSGEDIDDKMAELVKKYKA